MTKHASSHPSSNYNIITSFDDHDMVDDQPADHDHGIMTVINDTQNVSADPSVSMPTKKTSWWNKHVQSIKKWTRFSAPIMTGSVFMYGWMSWVTYIVEKKALAFLADPLAAGSNIVSVSETTLTLLLFSGVVLSVLVCFLASRSFQYLPWCQLKSDTVKGNSDPIEQAVLTFLASIFLMALSAPNIVLSQSIFSVATAEHHAQQYSPLGNALREHANGTSEPDFNAIFHQFDFDRNSGRLSLLEMEDLHQIVELRRHPNMLSPEETKLIDNIFNNGVLTRDQRLHLTEMFNSRWRLSTVTEISTMSPEASTNNP